jgi:V8-like Glu-specific endopeptidase
MSTEILNTAAFPYSAIVSVRSTFADGRVSLGTGSLVGKNDVLTATHVVYQPDHGGYATSVQVFPGADFNGARSVLESSPYGSFYSGSIVAFPTDVFIDANNGSTSWTESASDVAVIGLSQAVGFTTGWFGLATGHNDLEWATEVGYPGDGTGMMSGPTLAHSSNGMWISGYSYDGSTLLAAGSSGGPLYVNDDNLPAIIGVKSSGNSYVNYWADIDYKYGAIEAAISANDRLIGGSSFITGTSADDRLIGDKTNRVIDGLDGVDTVLFASSSTQAKIVTTGNHVTNVINLVNSNSGDTLTNVERLSFTNTNVALDVGPNQNAGSVYMLYKAAFNRAPDASGMGYWLAQKDAGSNIVSNIAQGFVNSAEFTAKYGINPSNASYVDKLYLNVLDRAGDAGGVAYWNQELDAGHISKAAVLVQFATLAEGAAIVAPLIANGIPYTEWVG